MNITVKRIYFRNSCTIGALQVENRDTHQMEYFCDTLEPHAINWQCEEKTAGLTAIPEGRYRVCLRYSKTFKRNMPFLENVPYFSGIMIHTGNSPKNTRGCVLVGQSLPLGGVEGGLYNSRIYFKKLYQLIADAIEDGEEVWVTVRSYKEWKA